MGMIVRRGLMTAWAIATAAAACSTEGMAAEPSAKPNVIVVLIDDMGWADLSCFGNREARTPRIDALAAEGIVFEQFYVNAPICSPSRVAISTGTYPQRWRITSYLAHRQQNEARGMAQWLDPKAPMLARALNKAGYATGHFGKWHMGGQRDVADAPPIADYGFDQSLTNFEGLGPKLLPLTKHPNGQVGRIWADAERLGGPVTWMQRSEITGGYVDAAIEFIARARKDGKPFFINLWPDDVHSPFWPPVDRWGDGSKRRLYLSVLENMDAQLGRLFEHINNDRQLRDNTLVILCSDNGPESGAGRAGPLRGGKGQLYEGGIRSPLVVWGPGLLAPSAAGKRDKESVLAAIDLAPSLLRLTGARWPGAIPCDGEEMLDSLLGKARRSRSKPIFFSRPPDRKQIDGATMPDLAVRQGRWKLLCDYDGSRRELYDLSSDPGEAHNLADAQPDVAAELADGLLAWHRSMPGAVTPPAESDARLHADGRGWRLDRAKITDPNRPRVLLIGDSILNGYSRQVVAALEGKADVDLWVNPYHQSEHLNRLLAEVLDNGPYHVVHFNMGLHGWQKGRIKEGEFQPLTKAYVEVIRRKLPQAKIIWASSTPVTVKGTPTELDPEINPIIVEHNRLAAEVMKELGVPVNDFYGLLVSKLELARGDQFHWRPEAYKLLADAAAESIIAALQEIEHRK